MNTTYEHLMADDSEKLKITDEGYDYATSEKATPKWGLEQGYTLMLAELLKRAAASGIYFNNSRPNIPISLTRSFVTELQILWNSIACWTWQPAKNEINTEINSILQELVYLDNLTTWNKNIRCPPKLQVRINDFYKKMNDVLVITGLLKKNITFEDKRLDEL